jgi:hypothetical protein
MSILKIILDTYNLMIHVLYKFCKICKCIFLLTLRTNQIYIYIYIYIVRVKYVVQCHFFGEMYTRDKDVHKHIYTFTYSWLHFTTET